MDKSVVPGDDFYNYADGTLDEDHRDSGGPVERRRLLHRRPGAREEHPRAVRRDPQVERRGRAATRRRIANYYNAYLNTDAIDRAGLAPAKADLDAIARDRRQAAAQRRDRQHAARRHRSAQRDQFPHRESVRHFRHPGAGDAGRAAALSDAGRHRPARARILSVRRPQDGRASRPSIRPMSRSCCSSPAIPTRKAPRSRIIDLETKIARAHATREESEDFAKGAQVWTRAELEQKAPGHRLGRAARRRAARLGAQKFDAYHPRRDPEARRRWSARSRCRRWKDWLAFHTLEPAGERPAQGVPRRQLRLQRHGARRARRSSGRATSWRSTRPATRSRTRSARPMSTNISRPRPRPKSRTWSTTSRPPSPSASRRSTGWRRRPSRKR